MTTTSLHAESESVYHAQAGKFLSSHLLGVFADCPALYYDMAAGKYTRPDKDYYIIGRAVHCLVLEGMEEYRNRYTTNFPNNPTTSKPYGTTTKKYEQWAEGQKELGRQPITDSQECLVRVMARSVHAHKEAMFLLNSAPLREQVLRVEYCGIPCQIRIDALGEDVGIVDFKTCDRLSRFPYAAKDYNYYGQLAFYREVLRMANLGYSLNTSIIAVEKQHPHRCGVWCVDETSLVNAKEDNEFSISELKLCKTSNTWPTGYEDVRTLMR